MKWHLQIEIDRLNPLVVEKDRKEIDKIWKLCLVHCCRWME